MQIEIRSSFTRDSKKLSVKVKNDVGYAISIIDGAKTFADIPRTTAMQGGKNAKNAYRMRIGDYRICFYFRNEIVELVRVLPRKNVYKVFP
jgi:mRNA interferase RelE/StbE